jgi:EAL domain-containing protein (putative c-di-GMP-specific phosphodiesterase class I)/GGDEF domain-containing protein
MPPHTEAARLEALRQLGLLDTPPSEAFDRITRMAALLFGLPVAAVSLTDENRQWFKSRVGVEHDSIPRLGAPCAEVADTSSLVVIPDMLADGSYQDCPLARGGTRFYAGAPLTTRDGFCLGAMCVLGTEPREASAAEIAGLQDLAAMVMAQIELQHAFGRVDPLSGMPNRLQFFEDLEDLGRDEPGERRLAVLIDLAGADLVAGAARVMGQPYVDDMVQAAGLVLRTALDTIKAYQVGPTQFAFIAPPGSDEHRYPACLNRTLEALGSSILPRFVASVAVGIAPFDSSASAPRDVLRAVHGAALDARAANTRVGIHSQAQDEAHQRRFRLVQDFALALEQPGQLGLVYQPRIQLASGACRGAEALLRWNHPTLGPISPAEFMPLVEQTSMARGITAFVLNTALAQLAVWRREGMELQLSVNISAANLVEADLAERVIAALLQHGVPPAALELEVTESAVMENANVALALLNAIAEAGIRIAIDDFGTGYSSLAYLQRLPAQVMKIDQSFLSGLELDQRRPALVAAMISLAHDIGCTVVAEGVETAQSLELISRKACEEAQGYLFARPMRPLQFTAWWRAREGRPLPFGDATASVDPLLLQMPSLLAVARLA